MDTGNTAGLQDQSLGHGYWHFIKRDSWGACVRTFNFRLLAKRNWNLSKCMLYSLEHCLPVFVECYIVCIFLRGELCNIIFTGLLFSIFFFYSFESIDHRLRFARFWTIDRYYITRYYLLDDVYFRSNSFINRVNRVGEYIMGKYFYIFYLFNSLYLL